MALKITTINKDKQAFQDRLTNREYIGFDYGESNLLTTDGYTVEVTFKLSTRSSPTESLIKHCIVVSKDGKVVDRWGNDLDMLEWYRGFYYDTRDQLIEDKFAKDAETKSAWLNPKTK